MSLRKTIHSASLSRYSPFTGSFIPSLPEKLGRVVPTTEGAPRNELNRGFPHLKPQAHACPIFQLRTPKKPPSLAFHRPAFGLRPRESKPWDSSGEAPRHHGRGGGEVPGRARGARLRGAGACAEAGQRGVGVGGGGQRGVGVGGGVPQVWVSWPGELHSSLSTAPYFPIWWLEHQCFVGK